MKKKGKIFIYTGLLLIAAAFFLTVYNVYDGMRAGQSGQQAVDWLKEQLESETISIQEKEAISFEEQVIPDYILNPDMKMLVESKNGIDYIGILTIPALEIELPVISEWSYANLRNAPCRYSGSAYKDDLVIAAHNYVTHFGGLQKLHEGDTAIFTDVEGNRYIYKMVVREILSQMDVEEMKNGEGDLTLFTCTLGGTNRITIRFEREDTSPFIIKERAMG